MHHKMSWNGCGLSLALGVDTNNRVLYNTFTKFCNEYVILQKMEQALGRGRTNFSVLLLPKIKHFTSLIIKSLKIVPLPIFPLKLFTLWGNPVFQLL